MTAEVGQGERLLLDTNTIRKTLSFLTPSTAGLWETWRPSCDLHLLLAKVSTLDATDCSCDLSLLPT